MIPPGSPLFMIKRIGYSLYLAKILPGRPPEFSHIPAGGLYFTSERDAQEAVDRQWPTVSARSSAQIMIARVA